MIDRTFIDELSSKAPTPGGGGASAYCGALASALASMVGNLTSGKKSFVDIEDQVQLTLEALAEVRNELIDLIDEDAAAFAPLAAVYSLPKATEEEKRHKEEVMQEALVGAIEVPLTIMRSCAQVITLTEFLAYHGSRMALSDAGVAVAFAKAALMGASLNVYINISSVTDAEKAEAYKKEADELIEQYSAQADEIYAYVMKEI